MRDYLLPTTFRATNRPSPQRYYEKLPTTNYLSGEQPAEPTEVVRETIKKIFGRIYLSGGVYTIFGWFSDDEPYPLEEEDDGEEEEDTEDE